MKKMVNWIKTIISYFLQKKVDIICARKLRKIYNNIRLIDLNRALERDYIKLWSEFGKKPSIKFLKYMVSINGINSYEYVPENIQYVLIEPKLNNKSYALAYNDKNFFERYLFGHRELFPDTVLRGVNGTLQDSHFRCIRKSDTIKKLEGLSKDQKYILKPATETGGGSNVRLITITKSGFIIDDISYPLLKFVEYLESQYHNNFVLQKKIDEHPWFLEFNQSSLNTVRMYCYRSVEDETVHPLHAYIRFGRPGSLVDSSAQGGRTCGIERDGKLNGFALGKFGEKYTTLPVLNKYKDAFVPQFSEMKKIAEAIASKYHYHRLLGFDFCVDKDDNIRLMEINTQNIGVINQQMNTGPLFREFTSEVLDYCKNQKKSIVLDFYV